MSVQIQQEELEYSIIQWIATFQDLSEAKTLESLSDGVVLSEIMNKINSEIFDLSKINRETNENWALKLNNLTELYERLEKFYTQVLEASFDKKYVDLVKISKNNDREQLYNLIEIVLGAAVQCADKETYINAILTLDESCQNELMVLIEKILSKRTTSQHLEETNSNLSTSFEHLIKNSPFKTGTQFPKQESHEKTLLVKLEELENENQVLTHKVNDLTQENDVLKTKLNELSQEGEKKDQEIRQMMQDREKTLEKLRTLETKEDFENVVKLRDHKIAELSQFIEELKQKHEAAYSNLQGELNQNKGKVMELSKLEGMVQFYRQKYEDAAKYSNQVSDLEIQIDDLKTKLEETNEINQGLKGKIEVYKESIEAEKTKNISLDIDITKKKAEIDLLKNEKRTLEIMNSELEGKVHEQNKIMEKLYKEHEETARHHKSTGRAFEKMEGQDFQELMRCLEKENETLRSVRKTNSVVADNGEKEILEKEIEILKKKLMEVETENEGLRGQISKSNEAHAIEKLNKENQSLKEEMEKYKKIVPIRKDENQMSLLKEMEDEIEARGRVINDLQMELDALKSEMEESEERNSSEIRLIGSAVQELALRNMNLEKQVKEMKENENKQKKNAIAHLNSHITPINFIARR